MKIFATIMLFLLFSVFCSAQDKAQTNQWRGLVLGEATVENTIETLGKPKSDKSDQKFRPIKFNEWFDVKAKDFRILHYEDKQNINGFDDVKLVFRANKLVVIRLEPKKLEANALPLAYDSEFVYLSDKFSESMNPNDFEQNRGQSFPKSYPTVYFLTNITPNAYAFAMVANNSFGSILGKSMGVKDASESLPGKVDMIDLISTSLLSKEGTNLLK